MTATAAEEVVAETAAAAAARTSNETKLGSTSCSGGHAEDGGNNSCPSLTQQRQRQQQQQQQQPLYYAGIASNGDASVHVVSSTDPSATAASMGDSATPVVRNVGAVVASSNNEEEEEEASFWKPRLSDLEVYAGVDDDEEDEDDDEGDEEYDEFDEDDDEFEEEEEVYSPQPPQEALLPEVGDDTTKPTGSDPAADMGEPQMYPPPMEGPVRDVLDEARTYLRTVINADDAYVPVRTLCRNKDPSCAAWAAQGECLNNPRFMNFTCAPVCRSCDLLHASTRCKIDRSVPAALAMPGDLDRLLERIVSDPDVTSRYQIQVLSRPDYAEGDSLETADYQLGMWLLQLDAFASPVECERLIELGQLEGYVRSADVGEEKEDGTFEDDINTGRTSMNSVRVSSRNTVHLNRTHSSTCTSYCTRLLVVRRRVPQRPARPKGDGPDGQHHRHPRGQPGAPAAAPVRGGPVLSDPQRLHPVPGTYARRHAIATAALSS
jgi:ShK domain-like